MSGFTKLWSEITDSSIWNEDDKTRILWITMLARMGPDSMVRASVGGLAHLARMSREDCEKSLKILMSPDPDSRSSVKEGRRIEKREGGFFVINGDYYRELQGREGRKAYMRDYMRKRREAEKLNVNTCKQNVKMLGQEEEEEEEEEDIKREREDDPDAAIPTLEEVYIEAEMRGIPKEHAQSFFEYTDNKSLWLNQHGKMTKWRGSLKSWSERRRTIKNNGTGNRNSKTIDRNQGTTNAGKASQYAGVGRVVSNQSV